MRQTPHETRNALGFAEAARVEFSFLTVPPFSMDLVMRLPLAIRFDGNGVAVVVSHDPLSYELGLALWRQSEPAETEWPYSISDLIRVFDADAAGRYRLFAATTRDGIKSGLAKLGVQLRQYGSLALECDLEFFDRLRRAREGATREFGREMDLRAARSDGESAWTARDWNKVATAYGKILPYLSPSERGRLGYARQQISGKP